MWPLAWPVGWERIGSETQRRNVGVKETEEKEKKAARKRGENVANVSKMQWQC
jgi:hypothetical protein